MKNFFKQYWKLLIVICFIIILIFGGFLVFGSDLFKETTVNNVSDEPEIKDEPKEEKDDEITPLLYEVTKDGSNNKMYLFGSIHVADDRAYPLPDEVMNAYEESDTLAVEVDVVEFSSNLSLQMNTLKTLLLNDGTTVKEHLEADTYEMMIKYLKDNKMYNSAYDYYKPAIHYSLITSLQAEGTGLKASKGIDMYFLEKAHKDKKEILEVESAVFQYQVLASLPDELFDFYIKYSIMYDEQMKKDTYELYENWLNGDIEALVLSMESEEELDDFINLEYYNELLVMLEEYNTKMIEERNELMVNKAKEYYDNSKNVFYVVGLAHIVGEDGMVNALKNAGYNVSQINYK